MKTHGRELETLARDANEVESTAVNAEGDPFVPGRFGIPWEDMGVNGIALHGQAAAVENHEVVKLNFPLQILALPAFRHARVRALDRETAGGQVGGDGADAVMGGWANRGNSAHAQTAACIRPKASAQQRKSAGEPAVALRPGPRDSAAMAPLIVGIFSERQRQLAYKPGSVGRWRTTA